MAQQTGFVESGVDRLQDALKSLSGDLDRLQHQVTTQRSRWEKQTRKRVNQFRKDVGETPWAKRAEKFSKDASREIESRVEDFLGTLSIASNADLQKVNRKLNRINKRLKALEDREASPTPPNTNVAS